MKNLKIYFAFIRLYFTNKRLPFSSSDQIKDAGIFSSNIHEIPFIKTGTITIAVRLATTYLYYALYLLPNLTPMKKLYFLALVVPGFVMTTLPCKSYSQCPGGGIPTGTAYDTTITIGSGHSTREIKFPKFDPSQGMVTCVRLTMTITGVVNYLEFENNDVTPNSFNATYNRHDTLSGPGLGSALTLATVQNYGPYFLDASDGIPHSGDDYLSTGPDTVLHAVAISTTVADSAALSSFYGLDSVSYFYTIDAFTSPGAPGNYSFSVFTSGFVNYKLEYCICPIAVLPLSIKDFYATKIAGNKAELTWTGDDDNNRDYHYEIEISNDGHNFSSIKSVVKGLQGNNNYKFVYHDDKNAANKNYFFRLKQVYSNGYTRFTDIRSLEFQGTPDVRNFIIYPNPSNGIVGIKFVDISDGKLKIQVFNTRGQTIVNKEVNVVEASYCQIAWLQRGVYWMKISDVTGKISCVNQLLIK